MKERGEVRRGSAGAFAGLAMREWRRFARQPTRAVGALGVAALFWLFVGSGLSAEVAERGGDAVGAPGDGVVVAPAAVGEISYAAYLMPGVALMVIMFAVVVWSIGLIQDRASGFLQSALVSPTPMWTVVSAKAGVGGAVAGLQGALILAAAPLVGLTPGVVNVAAAAGVLTAAALGVMALSLGLAWRSDSVAGFHSVMNVVLLPLWALSGAVFPLESAAPWLAMVMLLNPLTWANEAAGALLGARGSAAWWHVPALLAAVGASFAFALATMQRSAARTRPGGDG